MIATTYNATNVFLIQARPHWRSPVSGRFTKRTARQAGLSNREEREVMAANTVARLDYSAILMGGEAAAARAVLNSWDNRPVLCPFWPAETLAADYAGSSVQGLIRVWFEPDWSAWSLNEGTAPTGFTPSPNCRTCPVIYGKFEDFPDLKTISGNDAAETRISVVETGDAAYALTPKAVALSNGASLHATTFPVLNVPFTWGGNHSTIDVRIKSDSVGYGRKPGDTFYAQAPRTKSTLYFDALNTADLAYILKLFHDRDGSVKPFWCLPPHSLETVDRAFGRFFGDELRIEWLKPKLGGEIGRLSFEFLSLPPEQTLPGGETFASTIGPVAARWFGYKVECAGTTWRFTSYESAIAGPGGTFLPQEIEHGRITEEINLAVNDCTLTVNAWENCPFAILIPKNVADKMTVTIYEGTIADPGSAVAIYTGTAGMPEMSGPRMKIKLRGPGSILSVKGPRMVLQETCIAILGDSRCKKATASFETAASMLSVTSGVGEVDVSAAGFAAGYFRFGYAERTVAGNTQRIGIADSYALGSGNLGVLFASPIVPAVTGAEAGWKFYAGCDGFFSTCKDKFNNVVNFRGAPRMPRTNPSMIPIQQGQTGKK